MAATVETTESVVVKSYKFRPQNERVARVLANNPDETYIATVARERMAETTDVEQALDATPIYSVTFGRGGERYLTPRDGVADIIERHIFEEAEFEARKLQAHLLIDNYVRAANRSETDGITGKRYNRSANAVKFIELFLTDTRLLELLK
jgi:hypothetical protein